MKLFTDRNRPFVFPDADNTQPARKNLRIGAAITARFETPAKRIEFVAFMFCVVFFALAIRLAFVMVTPRTAETGPGREAAAPAEARLALRAEILDRDGQLLARSVSTQSILAVPSTIYNKEATAAALVAAFPDLDPARVLAQISSDRKEVRIKRHLEAAEVDRFLRLGAGGLRLGPDIRRVYPKGSLAAHVLGYVGGDANAGLAGIEAGMEARLAPRKAMPVQPGPLALSLSAPVQAALESELGAAAERWQARGAAGIVLDSRTGEILALASWPSFDLNRFSVAPAESLRNRALSEPFEMGSVIKPFTYAAALESGTLTAETRFDTRVGIALGSWQRKDPLPVGPDAGLADVLAVSSNVAAAQTALALGGPRLYAFFSQLGFEGTAGVETVEGFRAPPLVPGEPVRIAVSSYGYSFQMNLVMLASAWGTLANDGVRVRPTLIRRDPLRDPWPEPGADREGIRVLSSSNAELIRSALRAVVVRGTGKLAAVAGLDVIGKTGTAEKARGRGDGYDSNRRVASFAGIFPGFGPRYVVVVLLDEPAGAEGEAGGAAAAAPVAARVIARAAPLLGVAKQDPVITGDENVQHTGDGASQRGL